MSPCKLINVSGIIQVYYRDKLSPPESSVQLLVSLSNTRNSSKLAPCWKTAFIPQHS